MVAELTRETTDERTIVAASPRVASPAAPSDLLNQFARAQAINAARHAVALRPFRYREFGTGAAAPSPAQIDGANGLIARLRHDLLRQAVGVGRAALAAAAEPDTARLHALLQYKDAAGDRVKAVEQVWDFYFELFGQRQSAAGTWLLAADRIALDCYSVVYAGLGSPRSVPSPPPFAFMATGFSPATYRRGVPLTKLGRRGNPFPIVELPYHRLVNPWTLGAVHHEVSHNLQSDLGLWEVVPARVERRLRAAGLPAAVAATWARWNKEIWADLCGQLLGGPALIPSLMDVVAMHPARAQGFNPEGVHPTPYLRVPISLELLRRMGFAAEATSYRRLWDRLYPSDRAGTIPHAMLDTFQHACALTVDTICYTPYPQLGEKSLAQIVSFNRVHDALAREAAGRLATGTDPGIIPPRFFVAAARSAFERRLAPPERIATEFYRALAGR